MGIVDVAAEAQSLYPDCTFRKTILWPNQRRATIGAGIPTDTAPRAAVRGELVVTPCLTSAYAGLLLPPDSGKGLFQSHLRTACCSFHITFCTRSTNDSMHERAMMTVPHSRPCSVQQYGQRYACVLHMSQGVETR